MQLSDVTLNKCFRVCMNVYVYIGHDIQWPLHLHKLGKNIFVI